MDVGMRALALGAVALLGACGKGGDTGAGDTAPEALDCEAITVSGTVYDEDGVTPLAGAKVVASSGFEIQVGPDDEPEDAELVTVPGEAQVTEIEEADAGGAYAHVLGTASEWILYATFYESGGGTGSKVGGGRYCQSLYLEPAFTSCDGLSQDFVMAGCDYEDR